MISNRRWTTAAVALATVLLFASNPLPIQGHVLSSTEESEVRVVPNPHSCNDGADDPESPGTKSFSSTAASCDPGLLLSPHRIIRSPMATQSDTLIEVTTRKVLSVPVPIYHFRQPTRLSPLALPFKLILVSNIDTVPQNSLHLIPVDPAAASDSWFIGYSWAPMVYTDGCDGPIHVGWKFSNAEGGFFYALIVDAKDEERAAVQIVVGSIGEAIMDSLNIGMRAPAWMIDVLAKI